MDMKIKKTVQGIKKYLALTITIKKKLKMKIKLSLLIYATTILIISCGPSEKEIAEQKIAAEQIEKQKIDSIEKYMYKTNFQLDSLVEIVHKSLRSGDSIIVNCNSGNMLVPENEIWKVESVTYGAKRKLIDTEHARDCKFSESSNNNMGILADLIINDECVYLRKSTYYHGKIASYTDIISDKYDIPFGKGISTLSPGTTFAVPVSRSDADYLVRISKPKTEIINRITSLVKEKESWNVDTYIVKNNIGTNQRRNSAPNLKTAILLTLNPLTFDLRNKP